MKRGWDPLCENDPTSLVVTAPPWHLLPEEVALPVLCAADGVVLDLEEGVEEIAVIGRGKALGLAAVSALAVGRGKPPPPGLFNTAHDGAIWGVVRNPPPRVPCHHWQVGDAPTSLHNVCLTPPDWVRKFGVF